MQQNHSESRPNERSELQGAAPGHGRDSQAQTVELGRTRCYWTILDVNLNFIFLDPILAEHLGEECSKFIGTNLLSFVHPEELVRMRSDLLPRPGVLSGVQAAGVFGAVTRCRYARIPLIRKLLGCVSPPNGVEAEKFPWMTDYLDVSLTTSWIAGNETRPGDVGGAILAFFHANEDKNKSEDNDESHRSAWTNWCGPHLENGAYLSPALCANLRQVLAPLDSSPPSQFSSLPPRPPVASTSLSAHLSLLQSYEQDSSGPPNHVFQILDHTGLVLFSFPTPRGDYDTEDYAVLARQVVSRPRGNDPTTTTSCTRRYRSKHPVISCGTLRTIESVVIPYGAISFACYQTGGIFLSSAAVTSRTNSRTMMPRDVNMGADTFNLEEVPLTPGEEQMVFRRASHDLEEVRREQVEQRGFQSYPSVTQSHPSQHRYNPALSVAPQHYFPRVESEFQPLSPSVVSASTIIGSIASSSAYDPSPYPPFNTGAGIASQFPYDPRMAPATYPSVVSTNFRRGEPPEIAHLDSTTVDYPDSSLSQPPHPLSHSSSVAGPSNDTLSTSLARPPPKARPKKLGAKACEACGTTNSPEWRRGPSDGKKGGKKSLCNACGLRFARSQRKKGAPEATNRLSSSSPSASPNISRAPTPQSLESRPSYQPILPLPDSRPSSSHSNSTTSSRLFVEHTNAHDHPPPSHPLSNQVHQGQTTNPQQFQQQLPFRQYSPYQHPQFQHSNRTQPPPAVYDVPSTLSLPAHESSNFARTPPPPPPTGSLPPTSQYEQRWYQ